MTARPVLLVYRTLYLGDLLTGVPAIRGLAAGFPDHRLVLAVPPVLARLAACVADSVLPTAELAVPAVDEPELAVDLHGNGPASRDAIQATHPRRLVAYGAGDGPVWDPDEHEVARWCRLARWCGAPADPSALDLDVTPASLPPDTTIVHPGSSAPARRWPPERFASVAARERERGHPVIITGTRAERGLALGIARAAGLPDAVVFAGTTPDPLHFARLVAGAARVVCGDTGAAHVATAVRTPSVVLFGPTPPAQWGPPADRPWHRALWKGSTGDPHAAVPDPGLLAITVDEVMDALMHIQFVEV